VPWAGLLTHISRRSAPNCPCAAAQTRTGCGEYQTPRESKPAPRAKAGVGANTVNRFETGQDPRVSSVDKMRAALEDAGIEFIPENATMQIERELRSLPTDPTSQDVKRSRPCALGHTWHSVKRASCTRSHPEPNDGVRIGVSDE